MAGVIIGGKELAKRMQHQLALKAEQLALKLGRKPTLAVVLVGNNPASQVYVKSKTKTAEKIGIAARDITLPATISNQALQEELLKLSAEPDLDGILLQLPLPKGFNEFQALLCIDAKRDVDGLHPLNQGLLMRGTAVLKPCTPLGIMALIDEARAQLGQPSDISGLEAIVVGRSALVGKPVALMLLERNCTVTVCHSRSQDLPSLCRRADIVVAAVGKPQMVKGSWIKPDAIVVDVGINRLASGEIVGDVAFDDAQKISGAITPVPGGVGPMTITMLLANTIIAAESSQSP